MKPYCKVLPWLLIVLMSQISILSPINQQDFWLPGVFYTGKDLRLGALS